MKTLRTHALLLRQVDYGESDRVVTLLTADHGKLAAMARGARRSRKRFGAALAIFVLGDAELRARSGSDLYALTAYDVVQSHPGIATDLARVAHGSYATELVGELCPAGQPEPALFALLLQFYRLLNDAPLSPLRLRALELRILSSAGLAPQLDACVSCGTFLANQQTDPPVGLSAERGGILCHDCHPPSERLPAGSYAALRELASMELEAVAELELDDAVTRAIRGALARCVSKSVGRPLKSLEFIRKLNAG